LAGLSLLLAACGASGGGSTASPTASPTPSPTASSTAATSSGAAFAPTGSPDLENTGTPSAGSTVVVPTSTVVGGNGDAQVTVQIEVGGGPPATVILDTGSSGLLIDASSVGPTVTDTGQQLAEDFVSGTVAATLGRAPVTIGGVTTSAPIGIGLVHSGGAGMFNGKAGILGIATANGPTLDATVYTPVMQLPAPYDTGSVLDIPTSGGGTWTLGPVDEPAGATAIPFSPATGGPTSYPDGGTVYAKDLNLCWTVGSAQPTCGPTDFDLGNANTALNSTSFADLGSAGQTLPAGTDIVMATAHQQPLWSFTAGSTRGQNLVELAPLGSTTEFNTGIEFFFANLLAFDYAGGRLLIAPR
jgi:hypothetical protein